MSLSTTDYVVQGLLALLLFVLPWFLRPGRGCLAFALPFVAILARRLWRVFHFDIAMKNDVPGIAYLVSPSRFYLLRLDPAFPFTAA